MEAVQIVKIKRNSSTSCSKFILKENKLRSILIGHKDRKIVVVSAAGAFRQGKSFLLNVFLRYLMNWKSNENSPAKGWLKRGGPLEGFEYRGGVEGCTEGIWAWPELFVFTLDDGCEVAVMLVDCQGSFDTQADPKECAMIFAFSTLLSSIQIYNVKQQIQRDHLEAMQLFVEYGKLAADNQSEDNRVSPFQTLLFIVRDFENPQEFAYGLEGGKAYLERKLNLSGDQSSQLQNVKIFVWNTFARVVCCLSPHPGKSVAQGKTDYMKSIDDEFVDVLEDLTATLFHPANLVPKREAGQDITCSEYFDLLKVYAKPLENGNCIDPNTIFEANAKFRNIKLHNDLLKKYSDFATQTLKNDLWVNASEVHYSVKASVLDDFDKAKKLGGDAMAAKHRQELENDIEKTFAQLCDNLIELRNVSIAEEKARGFCTYVDLMNRSIQSTPANKPIDPAHLFEMHQEHSQTALKKFQGRIEQYNSGLLDYDCGPAQKVLCDDIAKSYEGFVNQNDVRSEMLKASAKDQKEKTEFYEKMSEQQREIQELRDIAERSQEQMRAMQAMMMAGMTAACTIQ